MLMVEEEIVLKGFPIGRGIAIGKPFFLNREDFAVFETNLTSATTPREIERYRLALLRTKQDIKRLQKQLEIDSTSDSVLILEAQLEMLEDPFLTSEIEKEIHKSKKNVEFVFQQAINKLQTRFKNLNDTFFEDRFKDLQDLARRVFSYLYDSGHLSLKDLPANSIVCTQELAASDAADAHLYCVSAFLTEMGGVTTHAAIVAKTKGIPYITHIDLNIIKEHAQQVIIVDGRVGKVIINPTEKNLAKYRLLQQQLIQQNKQLEDETNWPAQTFDGFSVRLCANLDMAHEIVTIHQLGGEGIGLFRSEYIFLPKNEIPSEEEQFQIYLHIIEQMKDLPVVIRTFDLGGDKVPHHLNFSQNKSAFIGIRSTRFLLKEQSLFRAQLKAIIRASVNKSVSILIPMVATLSELREAKRMIQEAREELNLFHPIRLGCMIEIPSAALIIDHFAKECDFFSIGTNDLIQYALAIDRGNQSVGECHELTDPSVIRLIHLIVTEANRARIPVSVCGEMASDPRFTALLLGLGVQELSVAPLYLPLIKNAIRRTGIVDAVQLSEKVLELTTSQEVLKMLSEHYHHAVPEDLFYNAYHKD